MAEQATARESKPSLSSSRFHKCEIMAGEWGDALRGHLPRSEECISSAILVEVEGGNTSIW